MPLSKSVPVASTFQSQQQAPNQSENVRPEDIQTLAPGAPVEREVSGRQMHRYRITLDVGQFALVQVEQRGAEAVLTADGPDGKEFAFVDLRIGGKGVEPLGIVAEAAGDYILKVRSEIPKVATVSIGRYVVKISELRAANEQDRARIKAQTLCYEARTLGLEKSLESKRKAVRLYQEALPFWRQAPERSWESAALLRLGILYIELTEFGQAKDYFSRAVIAMKAAGDRNGEAPAQNGLCGALHYLGDLKGKAECLDALTAIYRELGHRLGEANALSNKAVTYMVATDYSAALESAQQALRVFRAEKDRGQEAFVLNNLGQIYRMLQEHQLALDHYERALAILRERNDRRNTGLTLGDMAVTYTDLGDLPRALDYFRQALEISDEFGDRRTKSLLLESVSRVWQKLGETAKAFDARTQSLELARAVGDRQAQSLALTSLSEIYLLRGEKEKARDSLTEALEITRATGKSVMEAAVIRQMGKLAVTNGNPNEAIRLFQQSLSLARAAGALAVEREALILLAQTERERNNLNEARDYYEKAIELTESFRAKIRRQELRASYLAEWQDEYEQTIDLLMQMHQQRPNAGHAAAALGISERARARSLLETLAEARAGIRQGVDAGLLAEERRLVDQISLKERQRAKSVGNSQAAQQTEALAKEVEALLDEYRALQSRIRAVSPRYAALTEPHPLTAAQIQTECLDAQTVLLEFALGEKQSWLWAVTPETITSATIPPRAEIEASARKVYELLTARHPRKDETTAERETRIADADSKFTKEAGALSEMLLGGITEKLRRDWKNKRLLIVAGGMLEYLPFAALPLPAETTNQPLIKDYEVVNLPSASAISLIRREAAGRQAPTKTLAALADPVFDTSDPRLALSRKKSSASGLVANVRSAESSSAASPLPSELARSVRSFNRDGFDRLVFSNEEAEFITSRAPRNSTLKATGFEATRRLVASGELAQYRIVHFATHGLINSENPELSGLVLSLVDEKGKPQDGFLRMSEIFNLRLPADLVVLSACQTALGKEIKGEGLVGLTRGFMYAGAERVTASLWQVDDQATSQLMRHFYRGMLKEGLRPAAALRAAQLEMSRSSRWSSPYYWAGFVIQGEWK
ncbi:MAG TPA: CHAT domain-containing protein [Blastocatellia bacterium]|nr:CHAT domain-containing protein [Blastocatellia bacterium]